MGYQCTMYIALKQLAIPEPTTGSLIKVESLRGRIVGFRRDLQLCCWFNIGAASEDLVLLRKIEENRLSL
ncbi:hypothetical protein Tco_1386056 [Tanacetum coccineum]